MRNKKKKPIANEFQRICWIIHKRFDFLQFFLISKCNLFGWRSTYLWNSGEKISFSFLSIQKQNIYHTILEPKKVLQKERKKQKSVKSFHLNNDTNWHFEIFPDFIIFDSKEFLHCCVVKRQKKKKSFRSKEKVYGESLTFK